MLAVPNTYPETYIAGDNCGLTCLVWLTSLWRSIPIPHSLFPGRCQGEFDLSALRCLVESRLLLYAARWIGLERKCITRNSLTSNNNRHLSTLSLIDLERVGPVAGGEITTGFSSEHVSSHHRCPIQSDVSLSHNSVSALYWGWSGNLFGAYQNHDSMARITDVRVQTMRQLV